jgi:hypothetical protein
MDESGRAVAPGATHDPGESMMPGGFEVELSEPHDVKASAAANPERSG